MAAIMSKLWNEQNDQHFANIFKCILFNTNLIFFKELFNFDLIFTEIHSLGSI